MAKKSSTTPSRKSRQAALAKQKKERTTRYLIFGLVGLILIAGAVIFANREPAAVANFDGELAGIQIDGSADAPVQIVEYADFGCHACRQWHNAGVKELLKAQFGDDIAFSFRHFPIITPDSPLAAQASQCAAEQDAFWAFHDHIYGNTPEGRLKKGDLQQYAAEIGLETGEFNACVDSGRYVNYVNNDLRAARGEGARGTPSFMINGKATSASPDAMIALIESILDG